MQSPNFDETDVQSLQSQLRELQTRQAELEATIANYVSLYDSSPVGCVTLTLDGVISQCNLSLALLFGATPEALTGSQLGMFVNQRDQQTLSTRLAQAFTTRLPQSCLLQLRIGIDRSCIALFDVCLGPDRDLLHGTMTDMTKRLHVLNSARKFEMNAREDWRISGFGHWYLDLGTKTLEWTAEVFDLFEVDPRVSGTNYDVFLNAIHPEDRQKVDDAYAQSLQDRQPYAIEHRLLMADGRVKWISEACRTEFDPQGKPLRSVGIVQDITARVQADVQKLANERSLRNTLVREVHHRIKNNLQGMIGILSEFGRAHPEIKQVIKQVIGQVQSIAVIHGLQGQDNRSQVRLCELTQEVAKGVGALWFTHLAVGIPNAWERRAIAVEDAVPMALALNELMVNAVKHSHPSKSPVRVSLDHADTNGAVQISIVNKGHCLITKGAIDDLGGIGLQLVQALLPRDGVKLSYSARDGLVHTELLVSPPVISFDESVSTSS